MALHRLYSPIGSAKTTLISFAAHDPSAGKTGTKLTADNSDMLDLEDAFETARLSSTSPWNRFDNQLWPEFTGKNFLNTVKYKC
jgi:hypothetical protein